MRRRLEAMIRDDYPRADEFVSPPRVKPGEKPRRASHQPIMPGAPAVEPGKLVEGELFPIAGRRHAR